MLKNVYERLNGWSKVYLSKEYFCEMYPTCVSSKLCEFINSIWCPYRYNTWLKSDLFWKLIAMYYIMTLLISSVNFKRPQDLINYTCGNYPKRDRRYVDIQTNLLVNASILLVKENIFFKSNVIRFIWTNQGRELHLIQNSDWPYFPHLKVKLAALHLLCGQIQPCCG